jgi:transcriptional regulator
MIQTLTSPKVEMYTPAHFQEERTSILHELMRARPLAALVTCGPGGLMANHVPLLLDSAPAPYGKLRGHVSKADEQWRELVEGGEVLAIFSGAEGYISPSWYATKQQTGRVVPTWNYVAVHAYGAVRLFEEIGELRAFLEALTTEHEHKFNLPWEISDAPPAYVEGQLRAIVGFEITIARLEGKWKMSQNRTAADRAGVVAGLSERGEHSLARIIDESLIAG